MRKSKKVDCCDKQHPDHSKELSRLNRVSGQIEGVKRMIGEREYCPDILETHLDSCVTDALNAGSEKEKAHKIAELKELYRRFNE
jgi:DNA-binding FrmR family transcriptional regulator